MTLDEKAQALWDEIKTLDGRMRDLVAEREGVFQQYNEVLAMLRDREREEQPKTKWDEALEAWVENTLEGLAEVIPLRREQPESGS